MGGGGGEGGGVKVADSLGRATQCNKPHKGQRTLAYNSRVGATNWQRSCVCAWGWMAGRGAKCTLGHGTDTYPTLEKELRRSLESEAPTVMQLGSEAGERLQASSPLLPAAEMTTTPADVSASAAAFMAELLPGAHDIGKTKKHSCIRCSGYDKQRNACSKSDDFRSAFPNGLLLEGGGTGRRAGTTRNVIFPV